MADEWTSVSVKTNQKERLKEHKSDGKNMGVFIMELLDFYLEHEGNEPDSEGLQDVLEMLENIDEKIDEVSERDIDEEYITDAIAADVRSKAFEGTKQAIEDSMR